MLKTQGSCCARIKLGFGFGKPALLLHHSGYELEIQRIFEESSQAYRVQVLDCFFRLLLANLTSQYFNCIFFGKRLKI